MHLASELIIRSTHGVLALAGTFLGEIFRRCNCFELLSLG